MANVNAPSGLKPARKMNSGYTNMGVNPYYIRSDYATAMFVGDPVVKTGTANLVVFQGYEPGTLPTINKSTAGTGNASTGVIVGFGVDPNGLSNQYNPASTERIAHVLDDAFATFYIQDDGSAALASVDVGTNFNLVLTTAGSTSTGQSGAMLNATSTATTATLQLSIIRLAPIPGNSLGVNAIWEVRLNNHTEAPNTAGI